MKCKPFFLRDRGIRDNCLQCIRDLPIPRGRSDTVWEVWIKKHVKHRSDSQHGYYRVLLGKLSESGWEKPDLHNHMREKAGLWKTLELPNGKSVEVLKSTNDMSSVEMSELIEATLRSGAQEFEVQLPEPCQVWAA